MGLARDRGVEQLLGDINAQRIRETDSTLAAFGTRHTLSDTLSDTRGIGAARRWLHAKLDEYSSACGGCLRVEYDTTTIPPPRRHGGAPIHLVNVLAWLPGSDTDRVVVMGGHHDSCRCSIDPWDSAGEAPGADDDASGSSAVLELARVFSRRYPHGLDATIVFALYAGEEEGLWGSQHLAERLKQMGKTVAAGMTDDIVGNVTAENGAVDSTSVRIFGGDPDNGPSRELERYTWALGRLYQPTFQVVPVFRLDRVHRGGDHIPFYRMGAPALRFSERLENYQRQHLPTDVFAKVDPGYVARVARLNAATVASLAAAPASPDSTEARRESGQSGGQAWQLSWQPVPGATGYEVLVRPTDSPTWQRVIPVGDTTSYLLGVQLDDAWAGVRAVDAAGHRSLAAVVPQ